MLAMRRNKPKRAESPPPPLDVFEKGRDAEKASSIVIWGEGGGERERE